MTDEEQTGLSAAEEARVRALLAEAKHDEPMPEAVVARLDRVLAGLAAEPVDQPRPADVVRLAERRRRATRMLVAAAAVVVAGVGIGQLVGHGDVLTSHGSAAGGAARSPLGSGTDSKELSGGSDGGPVAGVPAPQADSPSASAFTVRPKHFAEDSRSLQSEAMADSVNARGYVAACKRGHWRAGTYVPVAYGRAAGYLVLRRHTGDSQVADLFLCGSDHPVRSVTLPGP